MNILRTILSALPSDNWREGKLSRYSAAAPTAFTLIELLIMLSIIAILVGLLLPSLKQSRQTARQVQDQSNLRQIVAGVFAYAADHKNRAPLAAPQELGGPQGIVPASDPWLVPRMFGGSLRAVERPLNSYLGTVKVFESPCDKGEPLWWFDTEKYQATSTCFELYGSSYFYASGYNRMGGVVAPMGVAKLVGADFSFEPFAHNPLTLGQCLPMNYYQQTSKKVVVGSIPLHRTISGVVASSPRAQWYKRDTDHLWAAAGFLDGHVKLVQVFPYDPEYDSVFTIPDPGNPYY